ncbi:MAG: hypothetical protein IJG57_01895 [Firmicutes bacterium]|nr:hypothetical protein [Bacillota bacterium]
MLRIREIKLELTEDRDCLPSKIEKKLGLKPGSIADWRIVRESVDARKKPKVLRIYSVDFAAEREEALLKRHRFLEKAPEKAFQGIPRLDLASPLGGRWQPKADGEGSAKNLPPVIVGFGPCGMFAALYLARQGLRPLVLERGEPMEERMKAVEAFWQTGKLDPKSNVQFGEGGAGTFSDGKLNSGIKRSYRTEMVLAELAVHGAPEEILYKQNPHVGTDVLREVVVNIRREIIELGGIFRFGTCFTGLRTEAGRLTAVEVNGNEEIPAGILIIAPGHSARDTFRMLREEGFEMEAKAFSIGARIEHPQSLIDESQYGSAEAAEILGAADYRLSYKCKNGRGVYTFCMCPGGYVVASASEEGGVVTNGMSYHGRDGKNANSALLVGVEPSDFGSEDPLAGVEFQRKWEQAAFEAGGGNYFAPAQQAEDFLKGTPSEGPGGVEPTYRPGVKWTDISQCLPDFATEAMREALPELGKKVKGFDRSDAVLTAVESRSSSPVRILRGDDLQTKILGVYPAGEGAGYAGGILSAAVDGIRVAEKICEEEKI